MAHVSWLIYLTISLAHLSHYLTSSLSRVVTLVSLLIYLVYTSHLSHLSRIYISFKAYISVNPIIGFPPPLRRLLLRLMHLQRSLRRTLPLYRGLHVQRVSFNHTAVGVTIVQSDHSADIRGQTVALTSIQTLPIPHP